MDGGPPSLLCSGTGAVAAVAEGAPSSLPVAQGTGFAVVKKARQQQQQQQHGRGSSRAPKPWELSARLDLTVDSRDACVASLGIELTQGAAGGGQSLPADVAPGRACTVGC